MLPPVTLQMILCKKAMFCLRTWRNLYIRIERYAALQYYLVFDEVLTLASVIVGGVNLAIIVLDRWSKETQVRCSNAFMFLYNLETFTSTITMQFKRKAT